MILDSFSYLNTSVNISFIKIQSMKSNTLLFSLLLLLLISCLHCCSPPVSLDFKKGDNWVEVLPVAAEQHPSGEQHEFQDFDVRDKKLYTSTTRMAQPNFFYCFNLQTGKVDWVNPIDNPCPFPPLVLNDIIYAITYVGRIYAFDLEGKLLWQLKGELFHSYSFNPLNHNLFISSMTDGILEYDRLTGKLKNQIGKATYHPSDPVFFNDTMIIGGLKAVRNDHLIDNGNDLVCFKYKNLKELWRVNGVIGYVFEYENYLYYLDYAYKLHKIYHKYGKDVWVASLNPSGADGFFVEGNNYEQNKIFFYINEQNDHKCYMIDVKTGEIIRDYSKNLRSQGFMPPDILKGTIDIDNHTFEYILTGKTNIKINKIK